MRENTDQTQESWLYLEAAMQPESKQHADSADIASSNAPEQSPATAVGRGPKSVYTTLGQTKTLSLIERRSEPAAITRVTTSALHVSASVPHLDVLPQ